MILTPEEGAAQLWCLPKFEQSEMDVEFAQAIAEAIRAAVIRAAVEAERENNCKAICTDCAKGEELIEGRYHRAGHGVLFTCDAHRIRARAQTEKPE